MKNDLEHWKEVFADHVKKLQNQITDKMRSYDGDLELTEDVWQRRDAAGNPGGGGITKAFSGKVFENAGVNTSLIFGQVGQDFAKKLNVQDEIWATGISLILHPYNPKVPTVHANFRMIHSGDKFWFGGGADLTPFYPHEEDFQYFHQSWKDACAPYNCYDRMKKECDEYFVNHHRNNEMRGVSGIFFDHFNTGDIKKDAEMVMDISESFIKSYFPIVERRMHEAWDPEDEEFQLYRRGRYVEFNLLHDRGTMFGLKTNGRTESILISLPARCKFAYKYTPKAHSPQAKMMDYYYPRDWV
jgi:coproporphyrinogen III oxidase